MKSFSDQLKSYRKRIGYTQESMSKFLGFSLSTYQAWEQGKRVPPVAYRKMLIEKIKHEIEIQNFGKLKEDKV